MKKVTILVFIILLLLSLYACTGNEDITNPYTLENLTIDVFDAENVPEGLYNVVYTINNFNRFTTELDMKINIQIVDENEEIVELYFDNSFNVVAGKTYTITITAITKQGNKQAVYRVIAVEANSNIEQIKTIRVKSGTLKNEFAIGETIDLNNAYIVIEYSSGRLEEKKIEENWLSNFNTDTIGERILGISYRGVNCPFNYTVINNLYNNGITYKLISNGTELEIIGGVPNINGRIVIIDVYENKNITSIGDNAFKSNHNLKNITFLENSNISRIGSNAFSDCRNLTQIDIPHSVIEIGSYAFDGCVSLNRVSFENGGNANLNAISPYTFNNCTNLVRFDLPDNISTIKNHAFADCAYLSKFFTGTESKLAHIEERAFYNNNSLKIFYINSSTPPIIGTDIFNITSNLNILVSDEKVNIFKENEFWSKYSPQIRTSIMHISFYSDSELIHTRNVKFGEGLEDIPSLPQKIGYTAEWDYNNFEAVIELDLSINAVYFPINIQIIFRAEELEFIRTIKYGATLTDIPNVPLKLGHSGEWDIDSFEKIEELELIVYAIYSPNTYRISFDVGGGDIIQAMEFLFDSPIIIPDATRLGHSFQGWYTTGGFSQLFSLTHMPAADITVFAKFSPSNYQLSFNTNGGNYMQPILQQFNTEITVKPQKDGFTFLSWYDNESLEGEPTIRVPAKDITLYAKWLINSYSIVFISNGGEEITDISVNFGESIPQLPLSERAGFSFDGWYLDYHMNQQMTYEQMPSRDIVLYAKWNRNQYSITFLSQNETVGEHTDFYNEIVTYRPQREGYFIENIYADDNYQNVYNLTRIPSQNIEVFVAWVPINYSISYVLEGGTNNPQNPSYYNNNILLTGDIVFEPPSKTGYNFLYWYYLYEESEVQIRRLQYISTGNKNIYAKWEINSYTISFDTDGGSEIECITQQYNTNFNVSTQKAGYNFGGWYLDSDYIERLPSNRVPAYDVTLYAKWIPLTYSITYIGGFNNPNPMSYTIDDDNIVLSVPQRNGYSFIEWRKDGVAISTIEINESTLGNITLQGWWTINSYTVNFYSNGGNDIDSITADYNTPINQQTITPQKDDYIFEGWYNEGMNLKYELSHIPSHDVSVYAKWKPKLYRIFYTLNGVPNNPNNSSFYTVEDDITLCDLTRYGYSFIGWFDNADFIGESITFIPKGSVSGNIYLYPMWEAALSVISFFSNGGSSVESITRRYGDNVDRPKDPQKTGYDFENWYLDINLTQVYLFTTMPAENINLYAYWIPKVYSITYILPSDASNTNPLTYTIESQDISLSMPHLAGHSFIKWHYSEDETMTSVYTIFTGGIGDISLTAIFTAVTVQVNLVTSEGTINGNSEHYILFGETDYQFPVAVLAGISFMGWTGEEGILYTDSQGSLIRLWDKENQTTLYPLWQTQFTYANNMITGLVNQNSENIVIPDNIDGYPINGIANNAFMGNTHIKYVDISENILSIGNNAFRDCSFLERVTLPQSLNSIGDFAFMQCSSLKNLDLAKVTIIGSTILRGCCSISSLRLPSSILPYNLFGTTTFANSYVANINNTQYYIPQSLKDVAVTSCFQIPANYLYGFISLERLTLEGVNTIGNRAFYGCNGLEYVYLPYNILTIGTEAFAYCENAVYHYDNLNNLQTISQKAFFNNKKLTSIVADNIMLVSDWAFYGCSSLSQLSARFSGQLGRIFGTTSYENSYPVTQNNTVYYLPMSLNTIRLSSNFITVNDYAFQNCSYIANVIYFGEITVIGNNAFKGSGITSFTLGDTVQSIGNSAFSSCKELIHFEFNNNSLSTENATIGEAIFDGNENLHTLKINGSMIVAKLFGTQNNFDGYYVNLQNKNYYIPDSLQNISVCQNTSSLASYSLYGLESLINVDLAFAQLNMIGDYAFYNCKNVEQFVIPEGVVSLGEYSFGNCSSLVSLALPSTLNFMGIRLFEGCSNMQNLIIDGSNQSFQTIDNVLYSKDGESILFYPNQKNDNHFIIPDGIKRVNAYLFTGNSYLNSISVPSSLEYVGDYAFYDCNSITLIFDGLDNLNYVGQGAFYNCKTDNVTSYNLHSLNYIGNYAFENTAFFTEITAGNIEYIGERAFANIDCLTSFNGNEINLISPYAFQNCINLTLFNAVIIIDMRELAFNNCINMQQFSMSKDASIIEFFGMVPQINYLKYTDNVISLTAFIGNIPNLTIIEIGNNISVINAYAFLGLTNLTEIVMIGNTDFSFIDGKLINNNALVYYMPNKQDTVYVIPEYINLVCDFAFCNNSYLDEIIFPEFYITTGENLFYNTQITQIALYKNEKEGILNHCNSLQKLTYSGKMNLGSLFGNGLSGGIAIQQGGITYTLPSSLIEIALSDSPINNGILENCSMVEKVTLSSNTTEIKKDTFKNCVALSEINLQNIVNYYENAFLNCESLTNIEFKQVLYNIEKGAFDNTGWINNHADGLICIGNFVYSYKGVMPDNCHISIPNNITDTLPGIFTGRTELYSVTLPENLSTRNLSFRDCLGLEEVIFSGNSNISEISANMFNNCIKLRSINLPNINAIYQRAFYNCTSLLSINIPSSVVTIGNEAFANCASLLSVTVPSSINNFGSNVFNGCSQLGYARIDKAFERMLSGCNNIEQVVYSGDFQAFRLFGNQHFNNSTLINYLGNIYYVPDTLTKIQTLYTTALGDYHFGDMHNLEEIRLNDGITHIGNSAFENCSSLQEIILPKQLTTIGNDLFSGCQSLLTAIVYTDIEYLLWKTNITHLYYYGDGIVANLFKRAYEGTYGIQVDTNYYYVPFSLQNVTVNGEVIGAYAFNNLNVESVTIGENVKRIGNNAFNNYKQTISFENFLSIDIVGKDAFTSCNWYTQYSHNKTGQINVGNALYEYKGEMPPNYILQIDEGTVSITDGLFAENQNIIKVILPSSLMYLGKNAFSFCENITEVVFNFLSAIEEIPDFAFKSCINLSSINIPDTIIKIGIESFNNCISLTQFDLPMGLGSLGKNAFKGCQFSSINVYSQLYYIGDKPFEGAEIDYIWLGREYKGILSSCYVKSIAIPGINNVHYLFGESYFAGSFSVAGVPNMPNSVHIPLTLTSVNLFSTIAVAQYAFYNLNIITEVNLSNYIQSIDNFAFYGCTSLTTLNYPELLTSIGNFAFQNCILLDIETLFSNKPLTIIGNKAFDGCLYLQKFVIAPQLLLGGESIFNNCINLKEVSLYSDSKNMLSGTSINKIKIYNSAISVLYLYHDISMMSHLHTIELYNVYTIPTNYFKDLIYVKHISINGATIINDAIFNGCHNLETFSIPFIGETDEIAIPIGYLFGKTPYQNSQAVIMDGVTYYIGNNLNKITVTNSTAINDFAFENITYLKQVEYSLPITHIGLNAFRNNAELTDLIITYSNITIADSAFYNCSKLRNMVIDNRITSIGNYAFYNCNKLQSYIVFDNSAEFIGMSAFEKCNGITHVEFNYTVTPTIGEYVFKDCENLERVVSFTGINTIPVGMFYRCVKLRLNNNSVNDIIPDNIQIIEDYAFYGCEKLTDIEFGVNNPALQRIGESSFEESISLKTIKFIDNNSLTLIDTKAFYNCSTLSIINGLTLNSALTVISDYAFSLTALVNVVLNNSLIKLGEGAFMGCDKLQSVNTGTGLIVVDNYTFRDCTSLNQVTLTAIDTVKDYAFYGCSSLSNIPGSQNINSMGRYCFANTGLTTYRTGNNLKIIPQGAFYECYQLTDVTFSLSLIDIYQSAFYKCVNLQNLINFHTLEKLERIHDRAFEECTSLTGIIIPIIVRSIGKDVFLNCHSLQAIQVEEDSEFYFSIDGVLYDKFRMILLCYPQGKQDLQFNLSSDISKLEERAFYGNPYITTITLNENIDIISKSVFENCVNLVSVALPSSLITIDDFAFKNCLSLTQITIPSFLRYLGEEAFADCISLSTVNFVANNSLNIIREGAFKNCTSIQSLNLSNLTALSVIEDFSFQNCQSIWQISFPNNLTRINDFAFADCSSLRTVNLGASGLFNHLGKGAFMNCISLTSFALPAMSITTLYESTFENCSSLDNFIAPTSLVTIKSYAFKDCSALTNIIFNDGLKTIESYAFENCYSLTEVILPFQLALLHTGAFKACSNLISITINSHTLISITGNPFLDCTSLIAIRVNPTLLIAFKNLFSQFGLSHIVITN